MVVRPAPMQGYVLAAFTAALACCLEPLPVSAQPLPEERSAVVLNAARLAYNDGNYDFAAEKFREYIRHANSRTEAASGYFGLGLCLLERPQKDWRGAVEALTAAVTATSFPEKPYALYYLGLANRGLAMQMQSAAATRPAAPAATTPEYYLRHAATHFAAAAEAFAGMMDRPPAADARELPAAFEWMVRSRCDQSDVLIRLKRFKEAATAVEAVVNNPAWRKSRYANLALYYHGYACFGLKNYDAAGHSLSQLAPFNQPEIGVHVQFLLARTHHLAGEYAEAMANYQGLVDNFMSQRQLAIEALKNPAAFKDRPQELARLKETAAAPPPDYVVRALFHWGVLAADLSRYDEALPRLMECAEKYPQSPVAAEARLRAGICLFHLRRWADAAKFLEPLADHPQWADRALRWLAKAQAEDANPANLDVDTGQPVSVRLAARRQKAAAWPGSLAAPIENLRKAEQRALAAEATDPEARGRRLYILLDLGDMLREAGQHKDAAATYAVICKLAGAGPLAEHAMVRQIAALQLAGEYAVSDQVCLRFQSLMPSSTLLPEVLARHAENALLSAASTQPPPSPQAQKLAYGEAIRRFQRLLEKYPEGDYAALAHYGIAVAHYEMGQFAEAAKMLEAIPENARTGELAGVSYFLADCLLRTLPVGATDALSAARLLRDLERINGLLSAFIVVKEGKPDSVDAIIKLGYCYQRTAALLVDPAERVRQLSLARRHYATVVQQFPNHPLYPVALFEAAKCYAQLGSGAAAMNELAKFQTEPLNQSPLAPIALMHMADALRVRGKPAEAVGILLKLRAEHEAKMAADPVRAEYVPILQYATALALKEAGRLAEAADLFQSIAKNFPRWPGAAEVPWRLAQCHRDQAQAEVAAARKALNAADAAKAPAAREALEAAMNQYRAAATELATGAAAVAGRFPESDVALHMYYDAAWCWRAIADHEIDTARRKLLADARAKLEDRAARDGALRLMRMARYGEVPLSEVPVQPAEKQVRACYKALIDLNPNVRLANDARFELAEYLLLRDEHAPAIALLTEALDNNPPVELAERMRLRLGSLYLMKNDAKAAMPHFEAILANPKSYLHAYARVGAGEALYVQGAFKEAIEMLSPMAEAPVGKAITGVSDRAVLRIAHAHAQLKNWKACEVALQGFNTRFSASPLVNEAGYCRGWALQNMKDYDGAVAAYAEVARRANGELAAKALFQMGMCRLEQNRPQDAIEPLLTVAYGYAYPEWSAAAMCEAARALVQTGQVQQAAALLDRVVTEFPRSPWADIARKRRAQFK